ncbi:hypothetical protein AAHA23_12970 [Klebsiella pneumoniae]|uniref:hypothetical protein n=1 Tax=Klebsiella pneumoniae TaxID=573 RepID=UPI00315A6778
MTDITELALLVSKAKASVFTLEYISQFEPADIDSDDVDLRFEVDGRDTGTNVSIVDECGQAAKVIGTLVEALEKAQETIAFQQGEIKALLSSLESRTVKLPDALLPATHKSGELFMTPDNVEQGGYLNRDDVLRVLRAAGIKVEAE